MKQLLWKEWTELRYIPLMTSALLALLIYCGMVIGSYPLFDSYNATIVCCVLAGILAGCGSFSSEIGQNTLSFLTSLPISRRQIWFVKLSAGLITIAASVAGAFIVYAITTAMIDHGQTFRQGLANGIWIVSGALSLLFFAVSMGVSPLVDRTLSSLVLAMIFGVALCYYAVDIGNNSRFPATVTSILLDVIAVLSAVAFLVASYRTVTRGETLRTDQRFYLTGSVLFGWYAVGCVTWIFILPHFIR